MKPCHFRGVLGPGDDNLVEAVEEAQNFGMKVVLAGVQKTDHRLGATSVQSTVHCAWTASYGARGIDCFFGPESCVIGSKTCNTVPNRR